MYNNHLLAFGTASFGLGKSEASYDSEDVKKAEIAIKTISELKINYIDTANVYQNGNSEMILGEIIKKDKSLRDKIVLQSKCGGAFDVQSPEPAPEVLHPWGRG